MALVKCRECGGQVSHVAPTCPHCGQPNPGITADQPPILAARTVEPKIADSPQVKKKSSVGAVLFLIVIVFMLIKYIQIEIDPSTPSFSGSSSGSTTSAPKISKPTSPSSVSETLTNKEVYSETTETLNYTIFKKEILKKGRQLNPPIPPRYNLIRTIAALQSDEELTEGNVKAVIDKIISEIRISDDPEAIVVFLHLSKDHIKGSLPLARAEWWPKGHSLSPKNAINIKNKNTYELEYNINLPRKADKSIVVIRLPELKRREIFTALVKSEDKAQAEAEAKYAIDPDKIPFNQLRTYDWLTAHKKNSEEFVRLAKKYQKILLRKYHITEEELNKIEREAFQENWPLP